MEVGKNSVLPMSIRNTNSFTQTIETVGRRMGSSVGQYFVTHVQCRQAKHSPQVPGNDQSRVQKWSIGVRREKPTGRSDH